MKKLTLLILLITFLCLMVNFPIPVRAQDRTPGPVIQGSTDPYEVTLYEEKDYGKPIGTWKLAPGMRLLKVPTISKVPQSILVGSSVGVLLFYNWNFSSSFHVTTGETVYFGKESDYKYSLIPWSKFQNSSPLMFPNPKYIPNRCSLIIHRKDIKDWLGAELQTGISPNGDKSASYQFYPLPEKASEKVIFYPKIPSDKGPYILGLVPGETIGFSWPYGHPNLNDIEVTGTGAYGGTFKFPDPNDPDHKASYELNKYGISQPSSLKIEYKGPFNESAYVYAARAVAPTAPNVAKAGTQIPQGYPAGPGKQEVPAAKVGPAAIFNVSGQWKNSLGWVYNITQQQGVFQWTVMNSSEKGNGTLMGYDLSVSWQGPQGSGSAQGKIIEVDANGTATKILWSNGVQFIR
jgi:hypothetical protein